LADFSSLLICSRGRCELSPIKRSPRLFPRLRVSALERPGSLKASFLWLEGNRSCLGDADCGGEGYEMRLPFPGTSVADP
jgi:hypothetical protein